MTIEIKVPVLPESVADATILTWHKKPGEFVERDENLVDIETDKVVLEVPAPESGVIEEILRNEGVTVAGEEIIAKFKPGVGQAQQPKTESAAQAPKAEPAPKSQSPKAEMVGESNAGPSARRSAIEHGVSTTQLKGSGEGGRITKQDVIEYAKQQGSQQSSKDIALSGERPEKRVAMSRLRARVAERLVEVQQTTAMLTTFNEVNLQAVMDLRSRYKEKFEKTHGARLGFMSFFTKAAVEALKRFPAVNASIDGTEVVYHGYYDIGIAVSTERGLVVPVLRNADTMSMAGIESGIAEYAGKARDGKLKLEEMQGGTFTITNGGVFGSLLSTPILNAPQSAILGMHKIEERAVVENGQIVIRPMMYLALSYDHRIIDGKESVSFLVTIKELLEDPGRLLLEV